jgi:hypothetical protein
VKNLAAVTADCNVLLQVFSIGKSSEDVTSHFEHTVYLGEALRSLGVIQVLSDFSDDNEI